MTTRAVPGYWTVSEIAELFPGRDGQPCIASSTVRRWVTIGLEGVQLRAHAAGDVLLIADGDLEEFLRRLGIDPERAMRKQEAP